MSTTEQIQIHEVDYHRNGISGEPFYAITFTDPENEGMFVATVFYPDALNADGEADWEQTQGWHNPRIAVLNIDKLPAVTFGLNSWRGDHYQSALYAAILTYQHGL